MILLTDEETVQAINEGRKNNKRDGRDGVVVSLPPEYLRDKRYVLKAQLKKVYELVDKIYNEDDKDLRLALAYFHQALQKEIEGN